MGPPPLSFFLTRKDFRPRLSRQVPRWPETSSLGLIAAEFAAEDSFILPVGSAREPSTNRTRGDRMLRGNQGTLIHMVVQVSKSG
jgi:hypothetical protein